MRVFDLPNIESKNYIVQNAPNSYNYTMNFTTIEDYIKNYDPDYQLAENSYVYALSKYDSTSLRYPLSHTPFNYEYLGDAHDAYHIALYINDQLVAYSNESEFYDYVQKIESRHIYFNNKSQGQSGYIDPHSEIQLKYKFKLQPGLLERKHFLIVTYPWSNVFDTPYDSIMYRERYRKLSGTIITPFEYSLSIENKYSLYLSYRLNEKDYFEEKFEFDYDNPVYEFYYMKDGIEEYVSELTVDGEHAISVYYFDLVGTMKFLDASHYTIDTADNKIILKNDDNIIVTPNDITEFYVSFIPESKDRQFNNYEFSYDPTKNITETLDVTHWDILGIEGVDVIPNLDAYYFLSENKSTLQNIVCYASQIAAYLSEGKELEFNIEAELENYDEDLIDGIHSGDYLAIYLDTNIKNIESLEYLTIKLYDNSGVMSGFTKIITKDELEMYDFFYNNFLSNHSKLQNPYLNQY